MDQEKINNLKGYMLDYLKNQTYYNPNKNGFFACRNQAHNDEHPSMMYNKKNNTCHCFACNATYDLFGLIQQDYNLSSFSEALEKAEELFEGKATIYSPQSKKIKPYKNYRNYYNSLEEESAYEYMLKERHINPVLTALFNIRMDKENNSIIIPINYKDDAYTERFLDGDLRYKHHGKSELFQLFPNPEIHYNHKVPPIYICEGEIDALSIYEGLGVGVVSPDELDFLMQNPEKVKHPVRIPGRHFARTLNLFWCMLKDNRPEDYSSSFKGWSIGLGSTSNIYLLVKWLESKTEEDRKNFRLVLALDNDKAGKNATIDLKKELDRLNIRYIEPNLYGESKDANDALIKDRSVFSEKLNFIYEHYDELSNNGNLFDATFYPDSNKNDAEEIEEPAELEITDYDQALAQLYQEVESENIRLSLDKKKLVELGILTDNNRVLKPKDFYNILNDKINNFKVHHKQENKYINSKAYEENTPLVLRNLPIFCCWKNIYDEKSKKYVKMPINPKTGKRAMINEEERCFSPVYDDSGNIVFEEYKGLNGEIHKKIKRNFDSPFNIKRLSDDMCSWTDFKTACEAVDKYGCDGIGINAVKHLNLFLVDIENCKKNDNTLTEEAQEFLNGLNTYAEYSPSGEGIHIIGYAEVDEKRKISQGNVKLYTAKHFLTLTGNLVEKSPIKVSSKKSATPVINELIKKYLNSDDKKQQYFVETKKIVFNPEEVNEKGFNDEEIIKKCKNMYELKKNNYRGANIFLELYNNGSWEDFFGSQSDADLFLVGRLAFFTTSKAQVDRLFRKSALMREKWDQQTGFNITYGIKTINYCFEKQKYNYK